MFAHRSDRSHDIASTNGFRDPNMFRQRRLPRILHSSNPVDQVPNTIHSLD
jgi:hypothetical protein